MKRELDWFRKQIFGARSEKQPFEFPGQGHLFKPDNAQVPKPDEQPKRSVQPYQRGTGKKQRDYDCLSDTGLRFGPDVPVEMI